MFLDNGGGIDNGGVSGTLLTDLSKAFDCILHDLFIAKLAAYGFDYNSLQMLQSYLSNRKQRTKINDAYSKYCEILFGVPQGSILGPLLFNIYKCFMILMITILRVMLIIILLMQVAAI